MEIVSKILYFKIIPMPFASIIIITLVLVGGGVYYFNRDTTPVAENTAPVATEPATTRSTEEETPVTTAAPETTVTTPVTPPAAGSDVAAAINGTYSANTTYLTPARTSHNLTVALTVANDVVTDATVTYDDGGFSNQHQERFDGAYKAEVVGKRLDSISLSRIGGASLTTESFNEAVKQIIAQAQS